MRAHNAGRVPPTPVPMSIALKDLSFSVRYMEVMEGLLRERGAPLSVLLDALGYLFCAVSTRVMVGDHVLLVAEVKAGKLFKSEPRPMVHYRKNGLRY